MKNESKHWEVYLTKARYTSEQCSAQNGALDHCPFAHTLPIKIVITKTHTQEGKCNGIALLLSQIRAIVQL